MMSFGDAPRIKMKNGQPYYPCEELQLAVLMLLGINALTVSLSIALASQYMENRLLSLFVALTAIPVAFVLKMGLEKLESSNAFLVWRKVRVQGVPLPSKREPRTWVASQSRIVARAPWA